MHAYGDISVTWWLGNNNYVPQTKFGNILFLLCFLLGLFDSVEKTYCYSVFILLLLFRTDFGHGYEENCKVFKIKTYLALLHLCWTPVVKLFSFTVRHVRSPKEKMSNLDGTLNLTYNAIEILETWKRCSSCLDLQKR